MREYGRIHCAFWSSRDVQSMSDDARTLAAYLLTSQHGTIAGIFRMPDGYVCEDLKWNPGRVRKGFDELFQKGFCNRCETTKWAWICKFLVWNPPENPNQWKAVKKIAEQLPAQCAWNADFYRLLSTLTDFNPPNPSETVTEPYRNKDLEQEKEQEQEQKNGKHAVVPTDVTVVFDHWKQTHNHPRAKLDDKREKLIRIALKNYSPEELCRSIAGYKHSAHHMGHNDQKTVYDDIELFLRDAKHIDAGLKFSEQGAQQTWQ